MFFSKCQGCKKFKANKTFKKVFQYCGINKLCPNCCRVRLKSASRAEENKRFESLVSSLNLSCACGLKYKAGHVGFSFQGINKALKQLWDAGQQKPESGIHMVLRGIVCTSCEIHGLYKNPVALSTNRTRREAPMRQEEVEPPKPENKDWLDHL